MQMMLQKGKLLLNLCQAAQKRIYYIVDLTPDYCCTQLSIIAEERP